MRYGEAEVAAIADPYASLPAEEFVQEMVIGLNLAFMRGAADAFRAIGQAADEKVEAVLVKDPNEFDEIARSVIAGGMMAYEAVSQECFRQYRNLTDEGTDLIVEKLAETAAMNEAPRVNAQVEGFKYEDLNLVGGPEGAR